MLIDLIKNFSLICTAGLLLPVMAFANYNLKPYFGADIGIKRTSLKPGYGKALFKHKQPVGSIFVGMELFPNLDAEIFLERTISSSKKKASIKDGNIELGSALETSVPGSMYNFDSKFKLSSIGGRLFYKFSFTEQERFKPIIGIGVKKVKAKLTSYITDTSRPGYKKNISLLNNNRKIVFTLSAGAEYMFTNNFGSRILFNFENTSGLNPSNNRANIAKLKNSFGANIGAIIKI